MGLNYNELFLKALTREAYFSNEDLIIKKQYDYLFNRNQLENYFDFKEINDPILKNRLDLKSFNSKSLYWTLSKVFSCYADNKIFDVKIVI